MVLTSWTSGWKRVFAAPAIAAGVFLMTALIGVLGYAGRNIEHRFDRVDQRLDRFEDRFDRLEAKIDGRFDRLEARVDGHDRDVTALTRRGLGDQ